MSSMPSVYANAGEVVCPPWRTIAAHFILLRGSHQATGLGNHSTKLFERTLVELVEVKRG